jgi:hypothetical protein
MMPPEQVMVALVVAEVVGKVHYHLRLVQVALVQC